MSPAYCNEESSFFVFMRSRASLRFHSLAKVQLLGISDIHIYFPSVLRSCTFLFDVVHTVRTVDNERTIEGVLQKMTAGKESLTFPGLFRWSFAVMALARPGGVVAVIRANDKRHRAHPSHRHTFLRCVL